LICKAFSWLASKRFGSWNGIWKALSWLSSKGFERLAWVLELERKACSRPASKRFEELEWALEVKLEGIIEAVLEEHREAGGGPGAGSHTHSRGFLREEPRGCNGPWKWIRKTFPGLASKRCDGLARAHHRVVQERR
jgi:hypothetical protein